MALQQRGTDPGSDVNAARYTERRASNFIGGDVDPSSGNIIPVSRSQAARPHIGNVAGSQAAGTVNPSDTANPPAAGDSTAGATLSAQPAARVASSENASGGSLPPPPALNTQPAASTTKLGDITADSGTANIPSPAAAIGGSLASAGGTYLGSTVGASLGSQIGAGVPLGTAFTNTASNATGLLTGAPQVAAPSVNPDAISGAAPDVAGAAGSSLGAGIGAGALAGVGTFAGDLISGKDLKTSAIEGTGSAVGAGVGFAIGNFVLPGIGGIVGSTLGSMGGSFLANTVFCHAVGTAIMMEDGTWRKIETLGLGERVMLGGAVLGIGMVLSNDVCRYRGTVVNAGHAVFEDGAWMRVRDSVRALKLEPAAPVIVIPLVTEHHLIVCRDYVCADFAEIDGENLGAAHNLEQLNANAERNERLKHHEFFLRPQWTKDEIERLSGRAAA